MEVAGRRITIMGLGRHGGGVGAARYLSRQGAQVTITDRADPAQLADSIAALESYAIASWRLGGHQAGAFCDADAIVVNPAVPPGDPLLESAARAGIPLLTEVELFLERCPARIAAVTGSNGKSSTTAMLAACLSVAGQRVWLGGNIGRSLLEDLPAMAPADCVVLELSSFQLARLSDAVRGVDLAVVTNCAPNHLDWHGSYEDYRAAKQRLLRLQSATSTTVLNSADPETASWAGFVQGRLLAPAADAAIPALLVPGAHQRQNARLAAAGAAAWGAEPSAIDEALRGFTGLPHRLERVAEIAGRTFYNDSLATTPESTCAALAAFDSPVWLLAGGYDKGADFAPLVAAIAERAAGVAFYGAVGKTLHTGLVRERTGCCSTRVETLRAALAWCWSRSRPGDIVLLSPACASYDQYRDYAARAEDFRRSVEQLAEAV